LDHASHRKTAERRRQDRGAEPARHADHHGG
jgi:hypothetical protein